MSNYSPGPWTIKPRPIGYSDEDVTYSVVDSKGTLICHNFPYLNQHDATLIAAAPELYELLPEIKEQLEWLSGMQQCSWFEQDSDPNTEILINKINKIQSKVN